MTLLVLNTPIKIAFLKTASNKPLLQSFFEPIPSKSNNRYSTYVASNGSTLLNLL